MNLPEAKEILNKTIKGPIINAVVIALLTWEEQNKVNRHWIFAQVEKSRSNVF